MKIHGHVTASPDREPTPVIGTQNLESRIGLPGRSEELDLLKRPSIPRSISYSQGSVSNLTGTSLEGSKLTLNVSDSSLTSLRQDTPRRLSVKRNVDNKSQGLRRHHSSLSLSNPKIAISKFMISEKSNGDGTELNVGKVVSPLEQERKTRLLSSSLSNLARPWGITSRSPSPTKRQAPQEVLNDLESSAAKLPSQTPPPNNAQGQTHSNSNGSIFTRSTKDPLTGKLPRRPLSAFLGRAESKGSMPSVATIPKSVSTDRLPSLFHTTSSTKPSSTLKSPSSDRLQGTAIDVPRRKDEIWPAFRNLDAEYQKFQSRPTTSRASVVRSALLPFLRSYADHPSNTYLRPEDLDRRINILNRWWTGLLEMLNGKNGESVAGNDRAAILEAASAIMIRPEWDPPSLSPSTRPERLSRPILKSRSTTSLASAGSDFLADSVSHNIRNTFSQNLLAQMAFVVDKMSTRNVAPSVVTFCGKAIAYAFFYCDGVAEILVRLWATPLEALRRVLAEYSVLEMKKQSTPDGLTSQFPLCLQALTFKSLPQTMRYLRSHPQLPIATASIPWHGPWIRRWAGRDTDLFFAFTKFFHNLTCRFLPDDHSLEERIKAPGYALVQAQILTVLDATLQLPNNQSSLDNFKGPSPVTFNDILGEADASATLLPHPANSAIRSMAENRLIILLRDCLSRSIPVAERGREIYAQSFERVLKAVVRRTSLFDHSACFALCDFMEEALAILSRFYQTTDSMAGDIDWPFWLEVMRKMEESQNAMTEIRLYAFIYSLWGTITSSETRKRTICLEWLLSEEVFQSQFNHWCPMVRAYFMRLLCWRVARIDGKTMDLDKKILETLFARLNGNWCHFIYLQQFSENHRLLAPSTAACNPAPGRRLLIVRDDLQTGTTGMFLSFDSILSEPSRTQATAYERYGSLGSATHKHTSEYSNRGVNGGKKRWALLRSMLPFASTSGDNQSNFSTASNAPASTEIPQKPSKLNLEQEKQTAGDRRTQAALEAESGIAGAKSLVWDNPYSSHSFKFSLEWIEPENNHAELERSLLPPKLPFTARTSSKPIHLIQPEYSPCKPTGAAARSSKYAGRALSEWEMIANECQNFFDRRKSEGVPTNHKVETPTLGVESFRKM